MYLPHSSWKWLIESLKQYWLYNQRYNQCNNYDKNINNKSEQVLLVVWISIDEILKNQIVINWLANLSLMMLVRCAYAKIKKLTMHLPQFDRESVVTDTKMKYFKYFKHDVYYICILQYSMPPKGTFTK